MDEVYLIEPQKEELRKLYNNDPNPLPLAKFAGSLMGEDLVYKVTPKGKKPSRYLLTQKGVNYVKDVFNSPRQTKSTAPIVGDKKQKVDEGESKPKNIHMYTCVSSNTPLKHKYWRRLVDLNLTCWKRRMLINPKIMPTYMYWELNAGPGIYPPGTIEGVEHAETCSSIDFIRMSRYRSIPADITICEKDPQMYKQCCNAIGKENWGLSAVTARQQDHKTVLKQQTAPSEIYMGLAYADPYGAGKEEWISLENLAKTHKYVDLLIHVQGGSMKRCRNNSLKGPAKGYLAIQDHISILKELGKCKFFLRFLQNSYMQTGLLFATHAVEDNFFYENIGFHDIESRYGKQVLEYMDSTKK